MNLCSDCVTYQYATLLERHTPLYATILTGVKYDDNCYLVVLGGCNRLQVIAANTDHLLRLLHEH